MTCAKEPAKIAGMIESANAANNPTGSQIQPQYCVKRTDQIA
jgi:hypothetical protein